MLKISFIGKDFAISDFDNPLWKSANSAAINRYWSGADAPPERHGVARLLWSESFLYARFDAVQKEPLFVNKNPDISKKTLSLWDRDVCEVFVAPDDKDLSKYFEFEVAPTGEWVDLAINLSTGGRETDSEYRSEMESSAKILSERVLIAMRVPWGAFRVTPKPGDVWRGNLFRIVGKGDSRGYLAWQPTLTEKPNFHVPEKFGGLKFVGPRD